MPKQNESMRDLQNTLLLQFKRLHSSLDDVTDAARAMAVLREMQEINHRIALTGGLLFAKQAKTLDEKVSEARKRTRKVHAAIKDMKNLQGLLDACSEFLSLVDEAIDIAKAL